MTKYLHTLALVFAFALVSTAIVRTQEKEKPAAPAAVKATAIAALKVQVVISRYQGEKKLSSMPYNLSITAPTQGVGHANLRMGAQVPVMMMAMSNVPKDVPQGGPIQYKDVGTNIDVTSSTLDDGRFKLDIQIEDSSVYPDEPGASGSSATKGSPTFRSFRAADSIILKDGGTAQFTTATDKVNGETVKVDVTLTVVK